MAERFVEDYLEIKANRRIVDVRPATTKAAEWMASNEGLVICSLPAFFLVLALPMLMPVAGMWLMLVALIYGMTRPKIPLRYPASTKGKLPKGNKADGILLFGAIRSGLGRMRFAEIWANDDSLRKHMLIIGSTGSGKSETLKGIFFNALCWCSGFFIADGKADNQLPLDVASMARSVGRDDSVLFLNFLLAGLTPQQVARSRTRRTNGINPFSSADADTLIQMGSNLLPKVEGEGKNWQEKALNLWRSLCVALCYKRDTQGFELSVGTFVDYMSLDKVGELYIEGYREFLDKGEWSYGYAGVKSYLESGGCPGYSIETLLNKYDLGEAASAPPPGMTGGKPSKGPKKTQDNAVMEQHGYRTTQLMPALNLLDKTYGYIFRAKYPEIDMVDVTLNDRILVMLIPSLEKSAQEAENLGKLAIACLRVMMGKNLGAGIEGTRAQLLDSKATKAPYPYVVALDELAYYFADGLAVIFAQARSLGMYMISATQDLKKLTEGARAAEAGAMIANTILKYFMRIDEAKDTWDLVRETVGKARVAVRRGFEKDDFGGWRAAQDLTIEEVDRVSLKELQEQGPGQGVLNTEGQTMRVQSFYMGDDLKKYPVDHFQVLRFLQVASPTDEEVIAQSIPVDVVQDEYKRGDALLTVLRYTQEIDVSVGSANPVVDAVVRRAAELPASIPAQVRAVMLYRAAREVIVGRADAGVGRAARGGMRQTENPVDSQLGVKSPATALAESDVAVLDEPMSARAQLVSPLSTSPRQSAPAGRPAAPAVQDELLSDLMTGGDEVMDGWGELGAPLLEDLDLPAIPATVTSYERKPLVALADPVQELVEPEPAIPEEAMSAFTREFMAGGALLTLPVVVSAAASQRDEAGLDWMAGGMSSDAMDVLDLLSDRVDSDGEVVGLSKPVTDSLAEMADLISTTVGDVPVSQIQPPSVEAQKAAADVDRLVVASLNGTQPPMGLTMESVEDFFDGLVRPADGVGGI